MGKSWWRQGMQQVVYGCPARFRFIQSQANLIRFVPEDEAQEFTDGELSCSHTNYQ
jgi:hypothetical protein